MQITVAICTWNRAALLRQALEQMTRLVIPRDVAWELLVVNNNCTDSTDEVIASFASVLPIRRLFEPTPGKSHALNLAVREAKGDYIIWTDDDALVDPDWVAAYCRAFQQWPDAAIFGGPVEPQFAGTPPEWLAQAWHTVAPAYATRNLGDTPLPFTADVVPFGVNMAVRRKEQLRHSYDPSLGPQPNTTLRGEETALVREMLATGITGWWVPDARLRHFIPEERQTIDFLRGYFMGQGEVYSIETPNPEGPRWFGLPRWLWRSAFESEIKYRVHRVLSKPDVWLQYLRLASEARGQMRGYSSSSRLNN